MSPWNDPWADLGRRCSLAPLRSIRKFAALQQRIDASLEPADESQRRSGTAQRIANLLGRTPPLVSKSNRRTRAMTPDAHDVQFDERRIAPRADIGGRYTMRLDPCDGRDVITCAVMELFGHRRAAGIAAGREPAVRTAGHHRRASRIASGLRGAPARLSASTSSTSTTACTDGSLDSFSGSSR